jgi:hypothetical protein
MTAGLYPSLTDARRCSFQAAIGATHRTGYLQPPTVLWDMLDEAVITIQCEAHDPSAAAETVRSIIRRNAEYVAQMGVREIEGDQRIALRLATVAPKHAERQNRMRFDQRPAHAGWEFVILQARSARLAVPG